MFCKWCGLESETSDICSWCHRPFANVTKAKESQAPSPATEDSPPQPASAPRPPSQPAFGAPRSLPLGGFGDDDDDFSPVPFGGHHRHSSAPPRPVEAHSVPPPAPPPTPEPPPLAVRAEALAGPSPLTVKVDVPVEPPPLVVQPHAGPAQPPAPKLPPPLPPPRVQDSKPSIEAIPIKRAGPPPAVIPISRPVVPPTPYAPPRAAPEPTAPRHVYAPPAPTVVPPPSQLEPAAVQPSAPVNRAPLAPEPARPPDSSVELGLKPLGDFNEDEPPIATATSRRFDLGSAPSSPPPPVRTSPGGAAPPPPSRTAVMTPGAGGRTYYCRWCGLESETADHCSWCKRDMRGQAQSRPPTIITSRHITPSKRGPVRQPVPKTIPPVVPPPPKPDKSNGIGAPQLGTFTAQKSKYYSDKVMDPVSGTHYDADSGETLQHVDDAPIEVEEVNLMRAVIINVAILIGLALVVGIVGRTNLSLYLLLLGVSNLIAGLVMPLLRTVPFGEDDSEDVALAIALIILLGPFVGGILYGVIAVMKGSPNPAIVGVFISTLVLRITLDAATIGIGAGFQRMMPFSKLDPQVIAAQVIPLACIAGWYAAGIFHKPDE